jgi:hypothetical protein
MPKREIELIIDVFNNIWYFLSGERSVLLPTTSRLETAELKRDNEGEGEPHF